LPAAARGQSNQYYVKRDKLYSKTKKEEVKINKTNLLAGLFSLVLASRGFMLWLKMCLNSAWIQPL
jgi:hypothetical protein